MYCQNKKGQENKKTSHKVESIHRNKQQQAEKKQLEKNQIEKLNKS